MEVWNRLLGAVLTQTRTWRRGGGSARRGKGRDFEADGAAGATGRLWGHIQCDRGPAQSPGAGRRQVNKQETEGNVGLMVAGREHFGFCSK